MNWEPNANIDDLKKRALIIQKIRKFFIDKEILEVETPALSHSSVTDVHLFSFSTLFVGPMASKGVPLYLQTSPEFHMKRLLAAGSGSIFQIAKAFRNEESGRFHNPEFTLLEWYRIGFDHFELMDEMELLLQLVLNCSKAKRCTYQEAFLEVLNVDPLSASLADLISAGKNLNIGDVLENETDIDTVLQLLFSVAIEPVIAPDRPCFVYDFPASQAALAKISPIDHRVAERFEVYYKGIELANGFHELTDPKIQLERFQNDNRYRVANNLQEIPICMELIEALEHGLPNSAGVALGIDRLIMLATDKEHIDNTISFTVSRA